MGECDRYCLSCWNAIAHSSDYSNSFHLCSKRKKGLHLSADLDMNRFKTAIIPVSFCTSLGFRGGCKLLIALIWSGFTSIPLWVTMYPKKFPEPTPKKTFRCIQTQLVLPQDFENACEIHYVFGHQLALHNHVINIDFNVFT